MQAVEECGPIATQRILQSHQNPDGGPAFARLDALKIPPTDFGISRNFLLGQACVIPQADDVLPELFEVFFRKLTHAKVSVPRALASEHDHFDRFSSCEFHEVAFVFQRPLSIHGF